MIAYVLYFNSQEQQKFSSQEENNFLPSYLFYQKICAIKVLMKKYSWPFPPLVYEFWASHSASRVEHDTITVLVLSGKSTSDTLTCYKSWHNFQSMKFCSSYSFLSLTTSFFASGCSILVNFCYLLLSNKVITFLSFLCVFIQIANIYLKQCFVISFLMFHHLLLDQLILHKSPCS